MNVCWNQIYACQKCHFWTLPSVVFVVIIIAVFPCWNNGVIIAWWSFPRFERCVKWPVSCHNKRNSAWLATAAIIITHMDYRNVHPSACDVTLGSDHGHWDSRRSPWETSQRWYLFAKRKVLIRRWMIKWTALITNDARDQCNVT